LPCTSVSSSGLDPGLLFSYGRGFNDRRQRLDL
jgi:hypothetical protein